MDMQQYPPLPHAGAHRQSIPSEFSTSSQRPSPMTMGPPGMVNPNLPGMTGQPDDGVSGHGHRNSMGRAGPFDYSRSPPNSSSTSGHLRGNSSQAKGPPDTSHVPCKFFRQGACQAGSACPFSHAVGNMTEAVPCKYFAKGNCKFGPRCANPHILPDGRRVSYGSVSYGGSPSFIRPGQPPFPEQLPPPAFQSTHSPASSQGPPFSIHGAHGEDQFPPLSSSYDIPKQFDQGFSSQQGSEFGSLPSDARLTLSPPVRALDTPLPPNFNPDLPPGIRGSALPSSLPSHYGFAPLTSTSTTPSTTPPVTAFGNLDYLARSPVTGNGISAPYGASPPRWNLEEQPRRMKDSERRMMHSQRRSQAKAVVSSSLPGLGAVGMRPQQGVYDESDDTSGPEEDDVMHLPSALSELLTPQENMRRFSNSAESDGLSLKVQKRRSIGWGSPEGAGSIGASPSNASPSSRYNALWAQQRQRRGEDGETFPGTSQFGGTSPFGVVGSPLRNTSLTTHFEGKASENFSPNERSISENTGQSGNTPKQAVGMLTEQLRRASLSGSTITPNGSSDVKTGSVPTASRNQSLTAESAESNPRKTSANDKTTPERSTSPGAQEDSPEAEPFPFSMEDDEGRVRVDDADEDMFEEERRKTRFNKGIKRDMGWGWDYSGPSVLTAVTSHPTSMTATATSNSSWNGLAAPDDAKGHSRPKKKVWGSTSPWGGLGLSHLSSRERERDGVSSERSSSGRGSPASAAGRDAGVIGGQRTRSANRATSRHRI